MTTRRQFIRTTALAGAGLLVAPTVVSATVFGAKAPSNRINLGVIGVGRIARDHDMPGVLRHDGVRITAVADLDARRLNDAQNWLNEWYARTTDSASSNTLALYRNYADLLADRSIDAVIIATPDHWHAAQAIDAVRAGKDVYLEKPASLTIAEGRRMSDAVNASGRILQIGSQQRSMPQFRVACELVRNGRIGQLREIEVRLPGDPAGGNPQPMPVPEGFDYDAWLGQTPYVPYTLDRVHPTSGYGRPGWLRCEQFGAGMITGWGAHHFDIAHWAMDTEYSGPVEVEGSAEFPAPGSGLWDVHGRYSTTMRYANGVVVRGVTESADRPNGVLFTGDAGWIFVSRGAYQASPNEPVSAKSESLQASSPEILSQLTAADPVRLPVSDDHHGDWLDSIRTRRRNIAPAEVGHRACTACLLQHIAMKLKRKLYWDPVAERFRNDDEANAALSRPQRPPYNF
jgi:predicted dehydrogenase